MTRIDKNAAPWGEVYAKLRHAPTNTKLERTPHNIEAAIAMLCDEAEALDGPQALFRIAERLFDFAQATIYPATRTDAPAVSGAITLVINGLATDGTPPARLAINIIHELLDMDLITTNDLRGLIAVRERVHG